MTGLEGVPYYTSRTLLDATELPAHLLVVGGGYVGCEFAQMFARFGSRVTVIQRAGRLLPAEDAEVSAAVAAGMTADGVTVLSGTTCTEAAGTAGDIRLGCTGAEPGEITGSHLLIAAGRIPNTEPPGCAPPSPPLPDWKASRTTPHAHCSTPPTSQPTCWWWPRLRRCEFAQMFAHFGSRVTVIQRAERLLPAEDPDISTAVAAGMTADGITVLSGTTCTEAAGTAGDIRLGCTGAEPGEITGSHLLIAAGRTPDTDKLGLEHLGLQPDPRGFLPVDETLRTEAEDVWALGDLRGGPMFTHTARDDANIIYRNVFRGENRGTTGRVVPHAVFTDPEVGSVGLTEPAARAAGYDVIIGRQDFTGVIKARAIGNTRGLVKFVADAKTDAILGCHIAGRDAGDLVHEAVIAMTCGASYTQLADAIHIHPTLAEGVNTTAGGIHREIGT
nr:FAD-dependent oxidoreductase [Mycobacterium intracellulare]